MTKKIKLTQEEIQDLIKICEKTKEVYNQRYFKGLVGLCGTFSTAAIELGGIYQDDKYKQWFQKQKPSWKNHTRFYIRFATITSYPSFWWKPSNSRIRFKFLNYLIKNLKNLQGKS